ncbi:MAG TPA: hypothetical protein DEA96_14740 [Leptospiraceae bacterium]|nr:hypothetical protein [Spirochaetaceae bacterium]HBS06223.1 hypothetical protein [Leptospiraceae bacterium]
MPSGWAQSAIPAEFGPYGKWEAQSYFPDEEWASRSEVRCHFTVGFGEFVVAENLKLRKRFRRIQGRDLAA